MINSKNSRRRGMEKLYWKVKWMWWFTTYTGSIIYRYKLMLTLSPSYHHTLIEMSQQASLVAT